MILPRQTREESERMPIPVHFRSIYFKSPCFLLIEGQVEMHRKIKNSLQKEITNLIPTDCKYTSGALVCQLTWLLTLWHIMDGKMYYMIFLNITI